MRPKKWFEVRFQKMGFQIPFNQITQKLLNLNFIFYILFFFRAIFSCILLSALKSVYQMVLKRGRRLKRFEIPEKTFQLCFVRRASLK